MRRIRFFWLLLFCLSITGIGNLQAQTLQVALSSAPKVNRTTSGGMATIFFDSNIEDLSIVCTEENPNEPITKINGHQWFVNIDVNKDFEADGICYRNYLLKCSASAEFFLTTEDIVPNQVLYYTITLPNELEPKYQEEKSKTIAAKAIEALDEGDSYMARLLALEALPPNKPYTFEAEYALRKACLYDKTILRGHSDRVLSASFSDDGKYIASVSRDKIIRIWEVGTGNCLHVLAGHEGRVTRAAFSHDGKYIISSSWDHTIRIWDMKTEQCIKVVNDSVGSSNFVDISPDNKKIVSVSTDNAIGIWEVHSGKLINKMKGHEGEVNTVSFSPDGNYVVSSSNDYTVRVWDAQTGIIKKILKGHTGKVNSAFFSPDAKMIVSAGDFGDNSINIWDVETGKIIRNLKDVQTGNIFFASFSPDGKKIVSGYYDKKIRIWDVKSGRREHALEGHTDIILSVSYSKDGRKIVSTSDDQTLRIWDVNVEGNAIMLLPPDSHLSKASLSPSGKIVAWTSGDGDICLWDVKGNKEIRRWKGSSDYISSLVFDPHEKYIATDSANSTIKIWEIASGKNVMTMSRKSKSSYMDIAYSPNGKYIASVSRDTIVSIWDTKTGEIVKSLKGKSAFSYVIFSPNCKLLATSSYDSAVRLWNVSSGDLVRTFGNCKGGINSISFSSDGTQIVAASMDNEMFVWDINMSKPLIEKKGRAESGYYASFSPNSNEELIASFSVDKTIRIWNSKTGKETLSLDCHSNSVHWVLLSQDCKYVICAFWDGSVRYWSYPPLQQLIDETRERFKHRQLTLEEKVRYNLE